MKHLSILFLFVGLLISQPLFSQFSVSSQRPTDTTPVFKDTIDRVDLNNAFQNQAKLELERKALRKERNTVEFESSFQMSQTQYDNWASGGENTFTGKATVDFNHKYQKDKFALDYGFDAQYGMNVIDNSPFKNVDVFNINFLATWTISESPWSYAASTNLKSQFSKGYTSRTDKSLISDFMSPGYFDVSAGFSYQKEGSAFSIILSPLTGSITTMLNDTLSMAGTSGVEAGKHTKGQLGPSIDARYDKKFKNDIFRYVSRLYTFSNIITTPTFQWDNTLSIYPLDFLSISIVANVYYDRTASVEKPESLQLNYSVNIGLKYNYKNK